ncbi:hypothetical protein GCL60_17040 (plasmid) [Silvanigrella paludirubra]|uniref:P-type conjugative transfer protein TrbG n=1 Tax=Silvanigrella paludirubra TaxID=2499159 RepID=A0A6N6VMK9_9BACT|nr:TrbG/VirB9 family P-type conjugative transfer protein [Silvanigrella paludirubra]KAB8035654.1 hypothetical protein GCL60_17040 [Silvanigrella paludirubra]
MINKNKILIISLFFIARLSNAQEQKNVTSDIPEQIAPYMKKISEDQKKELEKKETEAKEIQKGINKDKAIIVPAINVKKIKNRKNNSNNEDNIEDMYLNDLDRYRKIEKSKPYIKNGIVYYAFGVGEASIICSILQICDVELEKGESISNIQIGDSERWIVKVNNSTSSDTNAHILLKPKENKLKSNMIIFTDKRQYNIQLKSVKKKYFSKISFNYPQDENKLVTVFTDIPEKSLSNYKIRGDSTSWTPEEIRTDGKKTFIKLPEKFFNSPDMPTVYSLDNDGTQAQVNYRILNNWIIVDVSLNKGQLTQGVGLNQKKVIFTKVGTVGIFSRIFSNEK